MSGRILTAIVFTLLWIGVTGSASIPNILFGLLIAAAAAWLVRDDRHEFRFARIRPLKLLKLGWVFLVELLKSGIRIAIVVTRKELVVNPAIVAYPLKVTRDFEITLLANLITLTPGTMSVDLSEDRRLLYIHCVDATDREAVIADVRDGFERLILETFR